jgi:hypothetical protein
VQRQQALADRAMHFARMQCSSEDACKTSDLSNRLSKPRKRGKPCNSGNKRSRGNNNCGSNKLSNRLSKLRKLARPYSSSNKRS